MNENTTPTNIPWWGDTRFAIGEARYWRIGPLELWVERQPHEWLIQRRQGDDPLDSSLQVATSPPASAPDDSPVQKDRVAAMPSAETLLLRPRLADRTVIVRPRSPFHVPAKTTVRLFVSSPLWLSITTASHEASKLIEFPIYRPSDTWFGESTLVGEAAYSTKTTCRVDLEGLTIRPHRAITPITIENQGCELLNFDRIAVPVPRLSLFPGSDGHLWTESLKFLRREEPDSDAESEIVHDAPAGVSEAIAAPREVSSQRIIHVFKSLF